MSIRILHVIGGGEVGGAEYHILHLMKHYHKDKVTPFLGCLTSNSPFALLAESQGLHSRTFPMRFAFDLSPVISVVHFCRTHKIRLIHAHGIRANLIGRIAAYIANIPCITTVHSLPENDYVSNHKAAISLSLDNMTLPLSKGFITISNSLRDSVLKRLKTKSVSLPVKTIYNGISELDFTSKEEMRVNFRKQWGISEHSIVIGCIGRLHPVKGHTFLIEAMKLLSKQVSQLHLVIIGDGPVREQLHQELEVSGLSFTLTGYLSSAWQALPAMDVFVLPSISEGMGLVLLEAAQANIPIVASKTGGIPELIEDQIEGLLVRPSDPLELTLALSRILQDPVLSNKLTTNAAEKAKIFSLDRMAQETTSFYEELLEHYNGENL